VPVFINKPMVTSPADLDRILEAVREHGTPVMSASSIRYAPQMVKAQQSAVTGELGKVIGASAYVLHSIAMYMNAPHKWQDNIETGGGSIINMGIHGLDPLMAALGTGVTGVHCYASKQVHRKSQSEDTAVISFRYADGRMGAVTVICGTNASGFGLDVFGSERATKAIAPDDNPDSLLSYGYTGMMEAFLDMCDNGEMPISLDETAEIMRILFAARQSAAEGTEITL
jgi:predicted dehydrogenase